MTVQNKKNGSVATVVEQNEKFRTVLLEMEDGTTQIISNSIFKRWWNEVEEDEFEDDIEDVEDVDDDIEDELDDADSDDFDEDIEEIEDDDRESELEERSAKKRASFNENMPRKEKKPKKSLFDSEDFQIYAINIVENLGGTVIQRMKNNGSEEMNVKAFKVDGHMIGNFHYSKFTVCLDVRSIDVNTDRYPPTKIQNYLFDAQYVFTKDTKETRAILKNVINQAYKSQVSRNNKKDVKKNNIEEL